MLAIRSGANWEVRAPAKLNLWFEVLSRRSDGYHEVSTLMAPVSLCDTLRFRSDPAGEIRLTCETSAPGQSNVLWANLPTDERNLAVRAVALLKSKAGVSAGATMYLVKRIPAAAGLGGGSSDAAAALVAANAAWELNWSRGQLAEVATELGSDVPFFLYGRSALCTGRGESVEPVDSLGRIHFLIVRPPVGLGTAEVYRACQPADVPDDSNALIDALRKGDLTSAGQRLLNRLQPAAATLTPWIERLRDEFERLDLPGHQMSGSGSSYFGLCRSGAHARQAAGRLRSRGLGQVYAVSSDNFGLGKMESLQQN